MQIIPSNVRLKYVAIFASGVVVGMLAYVLVNRATQGTSSPDVAIDLSSHHATMHSCIGDVAKVISPDKMNPGIYERIWRLCENQIFNGLIYDDFAIRRQKFMQQTLDERVNLWLVVIITISGVFLAAVQLLLSYKLATNRGYDFDKNSELAVEAGKEAGKISLKSSITGVLILALSLAFFMIYVVYIYSFREVSMDRPRPSNLQTPVEPQEAAPSPQASPPVSAGPPQPLSPPKGTKK